MQTAKADSSYYLSPVDSEVEVRDLPVSGQIPAALRGDYIRNGPNPRKSAGHWFFGDGMLHGVRLEDGRARRYANRWIRTSTFETGARVVAADGKLDLHAGPANTSIVRHAGRLLALVESSLPYEVTSNLATIGPVDFKGRLKTPMTAHPKTCPATGELHFFGYSPLPSLPALTYHRATATGDLVETRAIDITGRTMMHDFAITERHVVFLDLPVVFDLARAIAGTMPYVWSDSYGARIGIMRRGGDGSVRWFAVEPCYVFHVLNAYERDGVIVIEAPRYREMWREGTNEFSPAMLHRWTLDLETGAVSEEALDERPVEFPRVPDALTGKQHRYGYAISTRGGSAIVKYDVGAGTSIRRELGPSRVTGEASFVPAPDALAEDDGWLIAYVFDAERDASDLTIFDARDLTLTASVSLPVRIPGGFHGTWFADQ